MSYPTNPAGPAIESSTNVFDVVVFQELVESLQTEAAAAVYRKFVENAAGFIDELSAQNTQARVETFHTLKGSAAMMGASRMSELAAKLEARAATVQVELATQLLKGELEKFRAALASRLLQIGASLDPPRKATQVADKIICVNLTQIAPAVTQVTRAPVRLECSRPRPACREMCL